MTSGALYSTSLTPDQLAGLYLTGQLTPSAYKPSAEDLMDALLGGHMVAALYYIRVCRLRPEDWLPSGTVFSAVSRHGTDELMQALLDAYPEYPNRRTFVGTSLHQAVRDKDVRAVEWLLKTPGIVLDVPDCTGCTPLRVAIRMTHPAGQRLVPMLLGAGATLGALRDATGRTPLMLEESEGFLHWSSQNADIAAACPVNACDCTGWTALHHAALRGDAWRVRSLLRIGADAEAPTPDGFTALDIADLCGYGAVVEALERALAPTEAACADRDKRQKCTV